MGEAVEIAEAQGVTLVFEPEVNNVVDSAQKARRLLDEVRSKHLQVVIDGANLFHAGQLPRMREVLDEAFDSARGFDSAGSRQGLGAGRRRRASSRRARVCSTTITTWRACGK